MNVSLGLLRLQARMTANSVNSSLISFSNIVRLILKFSCFSCYMDYTIFVWSNENI